jgi:hypothetical protein
MTAAEILARIRWIEAMLKRLQQSSPRGTRH